MYLYFLMALLWYIIGRKNNITSKTTDREKFSICIKMSIPLILVMGLRHVCVGSDTEQYLYRFNNSRSFLDNDYYQWEKGYNYLNYLVNDILQLNWQVFLIIVAAFFCFVLARFIAKYSVSPVFSFYLFMTITIFAMSLSGIRQCIALSICYIALMFILEKEANIRNLKNLIVPVLLVSIAYTFHNSSIIFIPFIILAFLKLRLSKIQTFFVILAGASSIVLKNMFGSIIGGVMIEKYHDFNLSTNYVANILVLIVPISIALFCLFMSKTENDGKYNSTISLMFVFISLTIFFLNLQSLNNQIGRLSYYFIYSYLVLIPYSFSTMTKSESRFYKPLVLLVCTAYFIIGNMGDIMQIDDYHFFWEDVQWVSRD